MFRLGAIGVLFLAAAAAAEPPRAGRAVEVPMRDGARLAADLYLPHADGRFPCILIQTPYDKRGFRRDMGQPVPAAQRAAFSDLGLFADREQYAVLIVDWRGFSGSRAAMRGVRRGVWRRGQDGYDCVEWAAGQDWCNGRVGTWGGSALGKQQLDTAAERPPHLVCAAPLIAAMGLQYGDFYEGGVLLEAHVATLDRLGFDLGGTVRRFRLPGGVVWDALRKKTYAPQGIAVPCLFITGWWDNDPQRVIETFEDVVAKGGGKAGESRLLIGPWDHVSVGIAAQGDRTFPGAAGASGEAAKAFFDHWLRGADDGWTKAPRVRYWRAGDEGWRSLEGWTIARRDETTMHLHPDGALRAEAAPEGAEARTYTCDPTQPGPTLGGANLPPLPHGPRRHDALAKRADTLRYTTGPLARAMVLEGRARLTFHFTADRVDCDFVVRLCDAAPDGASTLLVERAQRAKLRNGEPEPLTPGATYALTITMPPIAASIAKGHALELYVSGSASPRYERNPHTGADAWDPDAARPVSVTIHHDAAHAATLVLPRIAGTR